MSIGRINVNHAAEVRHGVPGSPPVLLSPGDAAHHAYRPGTPSSGEVIFVLPIVSALLWPLSSPRLQYLEEMIWFSRNKAHVYLKRKPLPYSPYYEESFKTSCTFKT